MLRVDPELHKLLAVRAMQEGDSLNTHAARLLKKGRGMTLTVLTLVKQPFKGKL